MNGFSGIAGHYQSSAIPTHYRLRRAGLLYVTRCTRYNLGWLPGGDKSITTKLEDTLESIEAAKRLVKHGGMISVMLYRGHAEVGKNFKGAGYMPHQLFDNCCCCVVARTPSDPLYSKRPQHVRASES